MSSINITITHDALASDAYATDTAPYTVSAWFTDPADGTIVTAERHGINPERLLGLVLNDLSQAADDIANLNAPQADDVMECGCCAGPCSCDRPPSFDYDPDEEYVR